MKIKRKAAGIFLLILSGICSSLNGQKALPASVVQPGISVEFENEAVTLANGYAEAFKAIPPGGKYIKLSTPAGTEFLDGSINSVKAIGGVLLIRTERGIVHVINARNIVTITNAKPTD
mgnify:CR=1 FL=1